MSCEIVFGAYVFLMNKIMTEWWKNGNEMIKLWEHWIANDNKLAKVCLHSSPRVG